MAEDTNRSEISFFTSLFFLTVAIGLIFSVLVMLKPSYNDLGSSQREMRFADRRVSPSRAEVRSAAKKSKSTAWPDENSQGVNFQNNAPQTKSMKTHARAEEKTSIEESDFKGLLSDAMRLVDDGSPREAMKILEQVLAADPGNENALVELGMIYLIDLKDTAGATTYFERALGANPNNKVVLNELINIYDELGMGHQGSQFFQKLYDENPDNVQLAQGLGQVLMSQDKVQEALTYLEKAAEDGTNLSAMSEYAEALSESGQSDRALDTYKKVLDQEIERGSSGFYDNQPGVAVEKVAFARMQVIGEYLEQKNNQAAEEQLNKIRESLSDEQIASLLDQYRNKSRSRH